jgi:hypothetical protein
MILFEIKPNMINSYASFAARVFCLFRSKIVVLSTARHDIHLHLDIGANALEIRAIQYPKGIALMCC